MTSTYDIQRAQRPTSLSNGDIYVTLQVKNNISNGTIEATYDEIRQTNLLEYPADRYKIALTNLSIPMTQTYLNAWPDPSDITNPDAYSITLALYDDQFGVNNPILSRQFCQFIPFVVSDPLLFGFGRVWFYEQYTQSINNAFKVAFDDIVTQYNAGGYIPALYTNNTAYPQVQPYIVCDSNSSLFYVKCDYKMNVDSLNPNACINPAASASPNHVIMQLSMNRSLYRLFYSFPAVSIGFNVPEPVDGRSAIFKIFDQGQSSGDNTLIYYNTNSNEFTSYNPFNTSIVNTLIPCFYKVYQQESTTSLFSNIDSIVVTCSAMQVRPYYLNAPINTFSTLLSSQGSTIPLNLLHPPIPLSINSFQNGESFSQYVWAEAGDFRWNDIYSTSTFNRLNFTINLYSRGGSIYPILLEPNQNAFITLLFRLK